MTIVPARMPILIATRAALAALVLGISSLLAASCALGQPQIVRVWVNRTLSAIEEQEAIIPACTSVSLTQAQIDSGLQERRLGRLPVAPPGTVDLTTTSTTPDPSSPKPIFIVVLPDGEFQYFFGDMRGVTLPACAGRAALP